MPSPAEINQYCMHLFRGEIWQAARLLNKYALGASKFELAARKRYLNFEYEKPVRRYVNVSPA